MNTICRRLIALVLAVFAQSCANAQRTLVSGSSQWGRSLVYAPSSVETYSMWVKVAVTNGSFGLVTTTRGPVVDNHYRCMGYGVNFFFCQERAGGTGYDSKSFTVPLPNVWTHIVAVFNGNSSRTMWVNGVAATTNTTAVTATSIDEVHLGVLIASSGSFYFDGGVAEPAIWHAALNTSEINQLASGGDFTKRTHPSKIRPDKLVWLPDLTIPGAEVPGVGGVTGISNSPAQLNVLPAPFK